MKMPLKFSLKKEHASAVKILKCFDVNHYETLCKYCADNDINIMMYSAKEFDEAVKTLENFGQEEDGKQALYDFYFDYYFWIDEECKS
jgi:hypothetical protein